MADDDDEILDAIKEAATDGIQRASGDQGSMEKVPIPDLIEADRYMASKAAAKKGTGLRFTKLIPGGAE